jgi:hypothetical protein
MMQHTGQLLAVPRIVRSLARFTAGGITLEESKALIRERLETREARFLEKMRRYVYGHPRSPYLTLLRHAGCAYGDLQTMVRQRGLEATLETLREEGVYLSYEEFKGGVEVVRGGRVFRFAEADFDNPFSGPALETETGGSRSAGSPVYVGLDFVAEQRAPSYHLMLESLGAATGPIVTWLASRRLYGPGSLTWLALARMGRPPVRWFSLTASTAGHRALLQVTRTLARRQGIPLPMPEFTPAAAPGRVLDTLLALVRAHGRCALITTPSPAVRIASLAQRRGVLLEGVRILVGSEPLTPGKAEEITRAGAVVGARYAFTEGGNVGGPCGHPEAPDDMHFFADSYAVILNRRRVGDGSEVNAYMFTSLLPSTPKVMLNVEIDDFGEFAPRRCGCPLDGLGLTYHFKNVRSFTKLTGEGATVLGTNCVTVLEEILPREFGGRSIDYQLLEVEDEEHITRLLLLISPSLGEINEEAVLRRFATAMQGSSSRLPDFWTHAGTIRLVRRDPVMTGSGKLLPFHTLASAPMEALRVPAH